MPLVHSELLFRAVITLTYTVFQWLHDILLSLIASIHITLLLVLGIWWHHSSDGMRWKLPRGLWVSSQAALMPFSDSSYWRTPPQHLPAHSHVLWVLCTWDFLQFSGCPECLCLFHSHCLQCASASSLQSLAVHLPGWLLLHYVTLSRSLF